MRGVFGFTANICGYTAIKLIPLAKATVLFYTNPIFIAIIGYLILKEKITNYDIGGIACTFIGVWIFTMDPFNPNKEAYSHDTFSTQWWVDLIGTIIGVLGAT